jgi:transcriptional regulator with XRE-family HTH domain
MPLNFKKKGITMNIGEVIKEIKYISDLNQVEIAEILGCSQVSVSRIRRNLQFPDMPLLFKIVKLAKKYNIKVKIEDFIKDQ